MAMLADPQQLQEVQAQIQQSSLNTPEKHFELWDRIETLPNDCELPLKQRHRHGGATKCSDHPSARRIPANVIPEYRYAHLEQLEPEERDKELFKIALADINPGVTLPQTFVRDGRHGWKMQTCGWAQTRAYLGVEGLTQEVDRWQFDLNSAQDWYDIQQRLITHEAMRKIGPGTSFGTDIAYLRMEHHNMSVFDYQPIPFQAVQEWERKFDECLSDILQELNGSLPSCSLYTGSTTISPVSAQTGVANGSSPLGAQDNSHRYDSLSGASTVEHERLVDYMRRFEAARSFDPEDDREFCPIRSTLNEQTQGSTPVPINLSLC